MLPLPKKEGNKSSVNNIKFSLFIGIMRYTQFYVCVYIDIDRYLIYNGCTNEFCISHSFLLHCKIMSLI